MRKCVSASVCKALSGATGDPGLVRGALGPVLTVHHVVVTSWTQLCLPGESRGAAVMPGEIQEGFPEKVTSEELDL